MSDKQQRRCEIVTGLIARKVSNREANELLGVTNRQVRRIRQRYEAGELKTLVHGNQGGSSPQRTKRLPSQELVIVALSAAPPRMGGRPAYPASMRRPFPDLWKRKRTIA